MFNVRRMATKGHCWSGSEKIGKPKQKFSFVLFCSPHAESVVVGPIENLKLEGEIPLICSVVRHTPNTSSLLAAQRTFGQSNQKSQDDWSILFVVWPKWVIVGRTAKK